MVRRNTTVRIDPLIEATPALPGIGRAAPIQETRATALFRKSFPGGQLVMTGAKLPRGPALRHRWAAISSSTRWDGYPGDADGEGDPVDLAIQRTATFRGRRKI